MKTTIINAEEIFEQQDRPGFVSPCQYGKEMDMLDGEIGSICQVLPTPPRLEYGLFVQDVVRLERIVVRPNVELRPPAPLLAQVEPRTAG